MSELVAEQAQLRHEEILDRMQEGSEYALDLNNLPEQTHHWIKRGAKLSCEGASHPHHSHWLR